MPEPEEIIATLRGFDVAFTKDLGNRLHLCKPVLNLYGSLYVAREFDWGPGERDLVPTDRIEAEAKNTLEPLGDKRPIRSGEGVIVAGREFTAVAEEADFRLDGDEATFHDGPRREYRTAIATPAAFEKLRSRIAKQARQVFDAEWEDAADRRDRLSQRGNAALVVLRGCGRGNRGDVGLREIAAAWRDGRFEEAWRRLQACALEISDRAERAEGQASDSGVRTDISRLDDRLRAVEVAFGKVDQRLATLERLHLPTPPAND